jgi:hypothetical protein
MTIAQDFTSGQESYRDHRRAVSEELFRLEQNPETAKLLTELHRRIAAADADGSAFFGLPVLRDGTPKPTP